MEENIKKTKLKTIKRWHEHNEKEKKTGGRTAKLIPNKNLKSNYFLTQYLTEHGNFVKYLKKLKITTESLCRK